ncbi:hypothetical protein PR202_gb05697 [Eleusine coracana subsp. coracana]|uniref:Uncharacterized protein n=1 Tax=Eleusine coracana subsp. coracana TaxID=191504 RepID=A0AAV5E8K7_ELECO|nr:hypothetical protein PR202_gb05697 [Eleusine coracana subsp. coracana]
MVARTNQFNQPQVPQQPVTVEVSHLLPLLERNLNLLSSCVDLRSMNLSVPRETSDQRVFLVREVSACVFKGWIEENGTAPVKPGTGLTVAVKTLNHDGLART